MTKLKSFTRIFDLWIVSSESDSKRTSFYGELNCLFGEVLCVQLFVRSLSRADKTWKGFAGGGRPTTQRLWPVPQKLREDVIFTWSCNCEHEYHAWLFREYVNIFTVNRIVIKHNRTVLSWQRPQSECLSLPFSGNVIGGFPENCDQMETYCKRRFDSFSLTVHMIHRFLLKYFFFHWVCIRILILNMSTYIKLWFPFWNWVFIKRSEPQPKTQSPRNYDTKCNTQLGLTGPPGVTHTLWWGQPSWRRRPRHVSASMEIPTK